MATEWPDIRDGVVHILIPGDTKEPVPISVKWRDAWNSKSQTDHIYLQKPDGTLVFKHLLKNENTPGSHNFELTQKGIYRLEVAGASFRYISVKVPPGIKTMFEPVKVHMSISLPKKNSVYFRVPPNEKFTFAAKSYGGPSEYILTSPHEKSPQRLNCGNHRQYSQFDRINFPSSPKLALWKVSWVKKGKVSFWLDNVPNVFTQRPEDFFDLNLLDATSTILVKKKILGITPAIGVAFPFASPPNHTFALINKWRLSASNHYIFTDYLSKETTQKIDYKKFYEQQFGIQYNNVIFAETGRKAVFSSRKKAKKTILEYLMQNSTIPNHVTYFSMADEPNLNYSSYEQFADAFGELAASIKNHPDSRVRNTQLAVPQSSRFLNGPTRNNSEKRIGIDWTEKLIKQYGQSIDAISWHEWLVRDLVDTNRYRIAVERADDLVTRYRDRFDKTPALIIGQTNISSGASLSSYENDTFFAALWWTSVVVQSSLPGKLQQLIWFKAADDEIYKKGLVALANTEQYSEKPVSEAMSFINENIGKWVMQTESNHPDLDIIATLTEDKKHIILIGVNKAPRNHALKINMPQTCLQATLKTLTPKGTFQKTYQLNSNHMDLTINGGTIFAIHIDGV